MEEAKVQQAAKCYAKMEAELQALRQQNQELMRALGEQEELIASEHLRGDRRACAQMQEFANLTAELLAGQEGPTVQLDGMCLNVKVEKPKQYDVTRQRISIRGYFKCANIWSCRPYQQEDTFCTPRPCYTGTQLCGGERYMRRIVDQPRGTTSVGS